MTASVESPPARPSAAHVALLALAGGVLAAASVWHYLHQADERRVGGAISLPKQLWLSFCLFAWFILPLFLATDRRIGRAPRIVLGAFAACMWARAVAQVIVMYILNDWRVAYGVSHDAVSIVLLGGLSVAYRRRLSSSESTPLGRWTLALLGVIVLTLILEIGYAVSFHQAVQGRTHGEDAVWFAPAGDPRFARINLLTAIFDAPLYLFVGAFLLRWSAPASAPADDGSPAP